MPLLRPLDPAFPIERQLAVDATPIVLVNLFTLDTADEQTFLQAWQDDALFMKRQPGFISTQLHRAIGESPTYLNYAVWEIDRRLSGCIRAPRIQSEALGLSTLGGRIPAPVSESRGTGHLRRVASVQEGEGVMKTKATGVVDFFTTVPAAARARATRHLVVSVLALLTFGVAWFLRGGIGGDVEAPELIVEAVGALLVGLSGFLGGSFVVVTGASSGIGAVAARRLAQRGATVVPVGRSRTATAAIAAEMGPNR